MGSSFCCRRGVVKGPPWIALVCVLLAGSAAARAAEPPTFVRGINLNGPPVTIDGRRWEGKDSPHYECRDKAFESQQVALNPATDAERAKMIRSSRWGGNRVELRDLPDGEYTLFLYVWEDNHPETFSIAVNDREVAANYNSGPGGNWEKLGPWYATARDGRITLTSRGGAANFSGIELWRGRRDGADAEPISDEDLAFFERRVRPLLVKHCYECHSAEAKELQGELLVDSRPTLRRGGSSGPAVVPGNLEESLLIEAVRYRNEHLQMPPDAKLSDEEVAVLEEWVRRGAPDPRADAAKFVKKKLDVEQARRFWSLRPVAEPPVPAVRQADWPRNEIDRFILAKLEERGLQPAADADRRTLIRRATFDVTGLPPSPAEIEAFLADSSPAAWERAIDRLLESPHYGERWGRFWMDLVRYADTAGDNSDYPVPQAYLYRNYIIDAFNADKPYDQFLREQIAGDLLPARDDAQRNEQLIATGYIAISRRFGSIVKDYPQHLTIEDTLDNLGRTVLGQTLACARCHDHKFDPITQEDYYGLYGMFASTRYPFPGIELDKKPRDFVPLWSHGKPAGPLAYAVVDGQAADARLHVRGEPQKLGDVVPRKNLEVLGGQPLTGEAARQSGRLQLAEWLTDPEHPLTARVMVNRLWQGHFGAGLVKTPSDFGARGQPPTHPELLDFLARRFVEDGWSIKRMHRRMMLSRAYQLASAAPADERPETAHALAHDPQNELCWRGARRRMDAETLRDTLLLLSGELDLAMPRQPHPFPPSEKWGYTQHHPFRDSYDSPHRSVYLMTARLNARPFFTTFDGADRNASTPVRDSSVTTVQSLYLLNNEFVHQQADRFAARLLRERSEPEARLALAWELALGRPPTTAEREEINAWLAEYTAQLVDTKMPPAEREPTAWSALARTLFRTNEFLYID